MKKSLHTLITCFSLLLAISPFTNIHADDSLVVYSARSDKFVKPIIAEFTRQTGIKVTLHSGGATALLNKLKLEGEHSSADLFLSNDAGTLQRGSELGLFQPLPEAMTAPIDARYRAADNTWVGLSARARVLVVNSQGKFADRIKSVFDLADPALKGKLAITHSSNDSFVAGVTVYMQAAGKEKTAQWLKGMKDNVGTEVFNKHSKIVAAVANGSKQVGLVNHYYIYRHLDKEPISNIRIVMPDQGADDIGIAWNVAGIAVTKATHKTQLAEKLVDFLVSDFGQQQFADANREYPTRTGVAANPQLPQANTFRVAKVPMYELGTLRSATIDLIESVGMP